MAMSFMLLLIGGALFLLVAIVITIVLVATGSRRDRERGE